MAYLPDHIGCVCFGERFIVEPVEQCAAHYPLENNADNNVILKDIADARQSKVRCLSTMPRGEVLNLVSETACTVTPIAKRIILADSLHHALFTGSAVLTMVDSGKGTSSKKIV